MAHKMLAEWFWIDRWMGSSGFLLPLESRGLYREMLTQAWRREARLPNDHEAIQRACGVTKAEWKRCWPKVSPFWKIDGEFLVNETQQEVYQESKDLSEKRSKAGSKGGSKTQAKLKQHGVAKSNSPSPSPSPISNLQSPDLSPSPGPPAGGPSAPPLVVCPRCGAPCSGVEGAHGTYYRCDGCRKEWPPGQKDIACQIPLVTAERRQDDPQGAKGGDRPTAPPERPPGGTVEKKPLRKPTIQSQAIDDWNDRYGAGSAPGGRISGAITRLVTAQAKTAGIEPHRAWEELVRPAWRRYLAEKDPQFATPQDFVGKFGVWAGTAHGRQTLADRNRSAIERWLQDQEGTRG